MTILRLSYTELGARLNRSTDAARVLARRRSWQRVTLNDGRVVVMVDDAELKEACPPERPGERPPEQVDTVIGLASVPQHVDQTPDLERIRAELTVALQQVDEFRERVRFLEASADHAAALLLKSTDRAARAEGQVVELHNALADLARRLDVATAELTEARRPWWRRLIG
jgi:hypothetical protein